MPKDRHKSNYGNAAQKPGAGAGGGGVYVSPFVAAGFTYFSARDVLTKWYTDGGSTLHSGTEDGPVQRITPSAGSLLSYFELLSNTWKYGSGANAKAINGKPVMYITTDSFGGSMASDVGASTVFSGKAFEAIFVVKRDSDYNNKSLFSFGTNAPAACRFYTGSAKAYGFLTGYVEAAAASPVGDQVVHVRFTTSDNKLKIAVNGGTFVEVAQTAEWSPGVGLLFLGKATHSIAEFGIYDGNYANFATLISALKTEYGIA